MNDTATAFEAWNSRWQSEAGRADWLTPEPEVVETATRLRDAGCRTALDLGAGVGRHALALARLGFQTTALDAAEHGLTELRRAAAAEGLAIRTDLGRMTALPYADQSFDYVLAFNVIYHGAPDVVAASIAEIRRVLKAGGLYQGTMLSKRNAQCGVGREAAPNTWVDDLAADDKAHPHFFCEAAGLVHLFAGFELFFLEDREHARPGSWHWHMVAERLP